MSRDAASHAAGQEVASTGRLRGLAWHVALAAVLTLLTLWPLLVLAAFVVAAHWAAELACGLEWLRC